MRLSSRVAKINPSNKIQSQNTYNYLTYKGKKITNSTELIDYLLDEANVAAVPGAAFGSDNHIRLSYATSLENIEEGIKRIKNAVCKLE